MDSYGFFMYFHLVCAPEFFAVSSGRKLTRKLFRQATEIMVLIVNPTSAPFASLSCPFHIGISLPLEKRFIGVFWDADGCEKPKSK